MPMAVIKVQKSQDGSGTLIIRDGWPVCLIPDEELPIVISLLKARRREMIRAARAAKRGSQDAS